MRIFNKIFKSDKTTELTDLTTIVRREVIEGFSIPGIIHNMQYHFTNLQVYSDGLIYCWEMVDLHMFKDKLNKGWAVTSIPNGESLSIFNLGSWKIADGNWQHTKETLYKYVYSLIKRLNPVLENLHNYNGSNSKLLGKVNISKHSSPDPSPYYSEDPSSHFTNKFYGEKFHIYYRNDNTKTYLVDLSLYKSGHIEITNLPNKLTFKFEDLFKLTEKGIITTELKVGETVIIPNLGSFKIASGNGVDINFKLNELTDKLSELNGNENSISKCARIFDEYKKRPTIKLKNELKISYEEVPNHRRIFVGTMDTKDFEVRQIIYGDIIKKEWIDIYGFAYPYDDMPKPIDE